MFAEESSYKKAPAGTGATERSLEFILGSHFFVYFPSNLERFIFEKGKTRGGGAVPPAQSDMNILAGKPRFFRETTGRMV